MASDSLEFADRHAQRTRVATDQVTSVALALGGRGGARLAQVLGIGCSPSTMLRLIRRTLEPALTVPRVLGVDDFALRRGHVYATVLMDMLTRRPIEVLPDRTGETLAKWLVEHPGVEIICRDGSTAYAGGAAAGAPDAVQVSDRWHLWRNLCQAVEKSVARHRGSLREPESAQPDTDSPADVAPVTASKPESMLALRTQQRYAEIQTLLAKGVSRARISRELKLDPHTVRRFANETSVEELLTKTSRQSILDEFTPYLCYRWNEGSTDAEVLFREIASQGFRGSVKTVRRFVQLFRSGLPAPVAIPGAIKPRQATSWIVTDPQALPPDHRDQLSRLLELASPSPRSPDTSASSPRC